jgi:CzcA family heavy metal efflux pump
MLNKIVAFSLKQPILVTTFAFLLLVFGIVFIPNIPIDVFPPLSRPTVTVLTEAPGYAAEEVEKLVTLPIENAMNGLPGVDVVRSKSRLGISMVIVEFGWNTNIYVDRQLVTEKLQTVVPELPPGFIPELAPVESTFGEILIYAMHSTTGKTTPIQMRTLADWVIKPRLLAVPGVSVVQTIGGDVKQYQILVNPNLLQYYDVSLSDVARAAEGVNLDTSGGYLQTSDRLFVIRNLGRVNHLKDIASGVVAYRHHLPIYIRDIARVVVGPRPINVGSAIFAENGKTSPCVLLNVIRQPDVNTLQLVPEIEEALKQLQASLPSDVKISEVYNQARFITTAVHNVKESAWEGGLIVVLVVLLFLFNVRTTLISLLAIPLSFSFAILTLDAFGVTVNTMTLGGLAVAVGMVIDDAIIDVENIYRRLRENQKKEEPKPILHVVYEASCEVRNAIFYATVIILLALVPFFFLPGISGRLFMPMALATAMSLLASLAVSLTVTPVFSFFLLGKLKKIGDKESLISHFLKGVYQMLLEKILKAPWIFLSSIFILLVGSLFILFAMPREFLPPFNEGSIVVHIHANPLTSVSQMERISALAEKILLTVPEIKKIGGKIGRATLSEDVDPIYHAELDAELEPSKRSVDAIEDEIRRKLSVIPGVSIELGQRLFETMDEMQSGARGQIVVKLFGSNLSVLAEKGGDIESLIAQTGKVSDLTMEKEVAVPELSIQVNRKAAGDYGLNPGEVNDLLSLALDGKVVSEVLKGTERFGLFVGYDQPFRDNLEKIRNTLIDLPRGGAIPIKTIAKIGYLEGTNEILHDNGRRRIAISCNPKGEPAGKIFSLLKHMIAQKVRLPRGYYVVFEGEYAQQQKAARTILFLSLAVLLAVFVILQSYFQMSRLVFQVMVGIPLSILGGVVAVFLSGGVLSIPSMLGFITVSGIAVRNGIMLVSHYLHLMQEEGEAFSLYMIVRGSKERLVPILMTALSAAFGVLPFAIAKGVAGKEILQPLCVVVLGGLVSATLLNLFVTPSLFWILGKPFSKNG